MKNKTQKRTYMWSIAKLCSKRLDAVPLMLRPAMTAVQNMGNCGKFSTWKSSTSHKLHNYRNLQMYQEKNSNFMFLVFFANVLTFPQRCVDQVTDAVNLHYQVHISCSIQYLKIGKPSSRFPLNIKLYIWKPHQTTLSIFF